uniref:N-acetylmuramoyl-L-alanine amidase n=1 Tax=OCS116 cluster bacterium TaxID=2030921 RepID=A0A2A4YVR1_9PROT
MMRYCLIKASKFAFICMSVWGVLGGIMAQANDVYDIRLSGGLEKTRVVIELNEQVAFQVYSIPDPDRLIIDFDAVDFKLPATTGTSSYGLVKEFRYGNFSLKKSRIVIDTLQKTEVAAAFIVPAKAEKGALLVVDIIKKTGNLVAQDTINLNRDGKQNLTTLAATSIDDQLTEAQQNIELDFQPNIPSIEELMLIASGDAAIDSQVATKTGSQISQSKIDLSSLNLELDKINSPPIMGNNVASAIRITSFVPKPVKRPNNMNNLILAARQFATKDGFGQPARQQRKPIIVLDAGHGGIDSGATSRGGTREKHVVLAFAKRLQKKLNDTGKFTVYLTRKGDYFIKLRDRVKISRKYKADLFISLHADSVASRASSARGASIYTLSDKSSDKEAAALARKENRSDILAGVQFKNESKVVASILIDLAQRDSKTKSVNFANLAVKQMRGNVIVRKRPVKFAGFRVLKAPDVPSVLIELGYLSNRNDERNLKSNAWQNKMASSIQRSVLQYFKNRALF